jgi:hypothetical protein
MIPVIFKTPAEARAAQQKIDPTGDRYVCIIEGALTTGIEFTNHCYCVGFLPDYVWFENAIMAKRKNPELMNILVLESLDTYFN